MAYQFTTPGRTIYGEGALIKSKDFIKQYGKKALIVTGKIVTKIGTVKLLTDLLDSEGIQYVIFNEILGEPTGKMVEAGVFAYKENKCDFLIGIGGGSPLDSTKAIAAMSTLDGSIEDYMGKELEGQFPPMVLIPTTAGTGSEATKFTIITDTKKDIKMLLKGEKLLPQLAIIDPALSVSSPKNVTSATGMDALTHAVEAYTSKKASPITDMYALSAIKRIFKYLPVAYQDGSDIEARKELSLAAYEAGVCINNSSVTLVHGMSRPIGASFHVPHGISNAMLLVECMRFAIPGDYQKFGEIGRNIGAASDTESDEQAAYAFLSALEEICAICEIPTLEEYGINRDKFFDLLDKMAQDALNSGSPANTIRQTEKENMIAIYKALWS